MSSSTTLNHFMNFHSFQFQLKLSLEAKYGRSPPDILECPSVIRNMRPLKQNHSGTIMGKFFISSNELRRRVYPDLCFGWLYVTTPRSVCLFNIVFYAPCDIALFRVGLQLSEVAALNSDELKVRANRDDYFITGFLREKLPSVKLRFNTVSHLNL